MATKKKLSFIRIVLGCLVILTILRVVACPARLSDAEISFLQWAFGILLALWGISSNTK